MDGPFKLERSLIRVSGPEAVKFLDNLLTQDVDSLAKAGLLYAALLSPQGKIICDMLLWPGDGGSIVIEAAPSIGADLLRRLSLYKLRAHVEIEDISGDWAVTWSESPFEGAAADPRLPALGWRRFSPRAETASLADGAPAYERLRIVAGVPDLSRDASVEEVFALEALLEELNGVDFSKGCFVGQENVSRMKRRATTRRKFCPIAFDGPAPPFGTPVTAGQSEVGVVRTHQDGRALALIRLDRANAAIASGATLMAGGRRVSLDPPAWLIQPASE